MTIVAFDPPLHFYLSNYSQTGFTNFRCQTGAQPETFKSRGGFMKLRHFDKHVVRNTTKGPAGKNVSVFFLVTLKTTFSMEYLTQKMDIIRVFFSKIRSFFSIFDFQKGQRRSLSSIPL